MMEADTVKLLQEVAASEDEALRDRLFAFYEDVRDSYILAMSGAGIPTTMRKAITREVDDYISRRYGD